MTISNTQYLRNRLLRPLIRSERMDKLYGSEWCKEFEDLMRHRLLIGAFRYGPMKEKCLHSIHSDYIKGIKDRLKRYEKTGNLEALADVANLCMLEFMFGKHPQKHFKSLDDEGDHCE